MFARYYGNDLPRFLSPDPAENWSEHAPQTWNFYTYVGNNPLRFVDPDGEEMRDVVEDSYGEKSQITLGRESGVGGLPGAVGGGYLRIGQKAIAASIDLNSPGLGHIIVEVVTNVDIAEGVEVTHELFEHEMKHVAAFRESFNELGLQNFDQQLLTKVEKIIRNGRKKGWPDSRIRNQIRNTLRQEEFKANRKIANKAKKKNKKIDKAEPHKKEFDGRGCDGRLVC